MTRSSPPKGFRDLLPQDKARRERLLDRIRATYRAHGFDEIETPVVEAIENLRGSEGGENLALIFEIMKRNIPADELNTATDAHDLVDLGLRYDLTVPLARFFAANREQLPAVTKSIQIAPVWRAERPQRGRFRQFVQCDIDILGDPTPLAEIELIDGTLAALAEIGLGGCRVRINDRRVLDAMLDAAQVPRELRPRALIEIDKLDKSSRDDVIQRVSGFVGDGPAAHLGRILEAAEALDPTALPEEVLGSVGVKPDAAVVADLQQIMEAVRAAHGEASIRFDPALVRGMGYYTGPIFEVEHPDSAHSVGGGGRYDGMVGRFTGTDVPACGFSLGFERLVDLAVLDEADTRPRVAIILRRNDAHSPALARQRLLIAKGYDVRLTRESKNKARMFDDLVALGIDRWQYADDDEDAFRMLGQS